MAQREVNIERLLGRRVFDASGKSVGRIEEVLAERDGDEYVVSAYLVGRLALLQRFSAVEVGRAILRFFRSKESVGYKVPWDKLDLSDPAGPCLNCDESELERFSI